MFSLVDLLLRMRVYYSLDGTPNQKNVVILLLR